MQYTYRARERGGRLVEGQIDAPSKEEALAQLSAQGLFVSALQEVGGGLSSRNQQGGQSAATPSFTFLSAQKRKPTVRELAVFCTQSSSLVSSGVPVLQTLRVMGQQVKAKRLGVILTDVAAQVEGGSTLGDAFARYKDELPTSMLQIIRVAEVAGNLDEGLGMLGKYYDLEDNFNRKVKSATAYPKIVLFVTFGVLIFMLSVVLPKYAGMFSGLGADLPPITVFVMKLGDFMSKRWYIWGPAILTLWFGTRYLFRSNRSLLLWWHGLVLRLPIAGPLIFNREVGRFTRTLATLLRSGVPIVNALIVGQNSVENLAIRQVVTGSIAQVEMGEGLVSSLRQSKLFPPALVEMMGVGEVTGNVEETFFKVGEYCEKDVSSVLDRLGSLLEPVLVVILGAVILGVMVPVLLPMFDLASKIH